MTTNWHAALSRVQAEGLGMFVKKNTDYGNAFERHGLVGLVMRAGDKLARLEQISSRGIQLVDDESLRDTLMDLHNYAGMAVAMMDNENISKKCTKIKNENVIIKKEDQNACVADMADECGTNGGSEVEELEDVLEIRTFESASKPGTFHQTERCENGFRCSCLGFEHREWCKHCEIMKASREPVTVDSPPNQKRCRS